ncbi:hypothetical protein C8J57DRAFT_1478370 [Mycena rebaudengoi]|nr:hypothetical protein C8J57DRAFT_1478370 [Mycena rebaudengoi]
MTDVATHEKTNLEQQCVAINAASLAKLRQCEINYYAAREQGYDVDVQEWGADCMSIKASSEVAVSSGKNTLVTGYKGLLGNMITFGFYDCGVKEEVAEVADRQHHRRKCTRVMGEERKIMYKKRDCKKMRTPRNNVKRKLGNICRELGVYDGWSSACIYAQSETGGREQHNMNEKKKEARGYDEKGMMLHGGSCIIGAWMNEGSRIEKVREEKRNRTAHIAILIRTHVACSVQEPRHGWQGIYARNCAGLAGKNEHWVNTL